MRCLPSHPDKRLPVHMLHAQTPAWQIAETACAAAQAYFNKALATHPDKGGDAASFRKLQSTFHVLRGLYNRGGIKSFASAATGAKSTTKAYKDTFGRFKVQE